MTKLKDSPELLSWKIHMARRNPTRAIAVIILILICSYFIFFTLEDVFLTLISTFVLLVMVLPYYLPVTYILSEEGVTKKMLFSNQSRSWTEFHRYKRDKNAIQLYTLKRKSRLDNYRSFLLICDKNTEMVLEIVNKKIVSSENTEEM